MVTFRPAALDDAYFLLQLRNDPSAYENFLQPKEVECEEHLGWLRKIISDKNRHLFIVLEDQRLIGQIRFDQEIEGDAEISVTISKEFRGMGYGKIAIASGSKFFLENHKVIKKIIARVKSQNQASVRSFIAAGYRKYRKNEKFIYLKFSRI